MLLPKPKGLRVNIYGFSFFLAVKFSHIILPFQYTLVPMTRIRHQDEALF